jgi:hypothetical protein
MAKWADAALARWAAKKGIDVASVTVIHRGVHMTTGDYTLAAPGTQTKGENMSKQLRTRALRIVEATAYYHETRQGTLSDARFSDEHKAETIKKARTAAYNSALADAVGALGQQGELWPAQAAALAAIQVARDKAELLAIPDVLRVQLAISRLPAVLRGCFDASGYKRWRQSASSTDKLACAYSSDLLRQTNWVEGGTLAHEAEAFLTERLNTQELQQALAALADLDAAASEVVRATEKAAAAFGDLPTAAIFSGGNETSFSGLLAAVSRSDEGEWARQEPRRFVAPVVYGGNVPEGGEGGAPAE